MASGPFSLIEADDSVLVAIDVQTYFLDKLPAGRRAEVVTNVGALIRVARWAGVPIVATAEELDRLPLAPEVTAALVDDDPVFDKRTFGLADQADIVGAIADIGRRTAVLVGLETDVCVLHSALGLLDAGYRVAVVADAVATPEPHHERALDRMARAGVVVIDRKGLFYEWLRTVEAVTRFHRDEPDIRNLIGDDW